MRANEVRKQLVCACEISTSIRTSAARSAAAMNSDCFLLVHNLEHGECLMSGSLQRNGHDGFGDVIRPTLDFLKEAMIVCRVRHRDCTTTGSYSTCDTDTKL